MQYKVHVKLTIPELEIEYELYIPINRTVEQVKHILNKLINDKTENIYPIINNLELYNKRSGILYSNKSIIRDTDIRNGTELILF